MCSAWYCEALPVARRHVLPLRRRARWWCRSFLLRGGAERPCTHVRRLGEGEIPDARRHQVLLHHVHA